MEIKSFRQLSTFKSIFLWWLHFYLDRKWKIRGWCCSRFQVHPQLSSVAHFHVSFTTIPGKTLLNYHHYDRFSIVTHVLSVISKKSKDYCVKKILYFSQRVFGWRLSFHTSSIGYSRKIPGNENVWTSPESFLRSTAFRLCSISTVTPSITFSYGKTGSWRSYWPWKSWWWSYIPVVHVHCKN